MGRHGMKLLVLEPDPSHGGGSEAVILSLTRELARRGHQVFLLHDADGSMLPDYRAFIAGETRERLHGFSFRAPVRTLACVARIAGVARRQGVDAIVSSHLGFILHCALVRTMTGIPACFHLGLPLTSSSASLRLALRRVGAGIAPSRHTMQTWQAGGWPAKSLHAIRNWVDPMRFKPVDDKRVLRCNLGLAADARLLVFVGRICEQKGVGVLIRAFAGLARDNPDVALALVGNVAGDYQRTLQSLLDDLEPKVRGAITLVPATAAPERYYAAADVACAPSLDDEAFGLTILEAMACGVPVVTSRVGILPDIIGEEDGNLLVSAGHVDQLRERLEFWLGPQAPRAECGMRLRRRVRERFGPDPSVEQYEHVLAGLTRR